MEKDTENEIQQTTISGMLQSVDATLKRIERILVPKVWKFEPKIETSSEDSLSGQCNFPESDFSFLENPDPIVTEKLLWAFEKDEKTEDIVIVPMNGDRIVIHGKNEAEMLCSSLIGYFQ
ncbi:MAG: hypothetical protein K2G55_01725 [Lachnospiraceae bacterium]|nr:hypothetical protein [Lachnospiraceae bacterium]MDE7205148.1 hypothetical protein [Lachnospiraceae bacterium]